VLYFLAELGVGWAMAIGARPIYRPAMAVPVVRNISPLLGIFRARAIVSTR
jgi:hypothetical protein